MQEKSRYSIDIVDVTLDLIEYLSQDAAHPHKASQLSRELDISHNRVFRILKTLEARGYVETFSRSDGYRLGLSFVTIGERVRERVNLRREAAPVLNGLAEKTGDAVYLAMRHGLNAMIIDRVLGHHTVQATMAVGESIPLYQGACGRILLATIDNEDFYPVVEQLANTLNEVKPFDRNGLLVHLDEIRRRGYDVDEGEIAHGAYGVAVPISDHTGEVVASLTVKAPSARYNPSRRDKLIKLLVQEASQLSEQLGYVAPKKRPVQPTTKRLYWEPRRRLNDISWEKTSSGVPAHAEVERRRFEIEAMNIIQAAEEQGLTLRLLGALAFRLQCPRYGYLQKALGRTYSDINFAAYREQANRIQSFFTSLGYGEDSEINFLYAGQRMIFYHPIIQGLVVDIFFDRLDFCHEVPWVGRLENDPLTIPYAELLMEKLQIVEINEKDIIDTIMLLLEHCLGDGDDDCMNIDLISRYCARDWGVWRTFTMNLDKIERMARTYDELEEREKNLVTLQVKTILDRIEQMPKSTAWKLRSRVGDRVKWYQDVDDISY